MHIDLSDKRVIVTGASRGIGCAIAGAFAKEGARVAICARSDTEVQTAGRALKELGAQDVIARAVDVTDTPGVQAFIAEIAAAWGGHVAIIGFLEGKTSTISLPAVMGKAVDIRGVSVGSRKDTEDLLSFLEQHQIEPVIDAVYDFSKLPDALDHLDRGPFGKIVVELR